MFVHSSVKKRDYMEYMSHMSPNIGLADYTVNALPNPVFFYPSVFPIFRGKINLLTHKNFQFV